MDEPDEVAGSLEASVTASTVAATAAGTITPCDGAAVDLAISYARQLDLEVAADDARAKHATATLGPLLRQVLHALGCSPAGRTEIAAGPKRRGRPTNAETDARRRAIAEHNESEGKRNGS